MTEASNTYANDDVQNDQYNSDKLSTEANRHDVVFLWRPIPGITDDRTAM